MRAALTGMTVRLRVTLLYSSVFLLSGFALLALTNLLVLGSDTTVSVGPDTDGQVGRPDDLAAAQQQIRLLSEQLSQAHSQQSQQLLTGSLIALVVMAVVSIVLGKLVAKRVLRPLRTISTITRRISAESLHERLNVTGPADEVKDLADTVDGLLERLEVSFVAQRRFVANASHELRTPLTTMRATLDVTMAKPDPVPAQTAVLVDRLRAELDHMDQLLDGLLVLARAQHGVSSEPERVSFGRLAAAALAARAVEIQAKNLTVEVEDVSDQAVTQGSSSLLAPLVENLVDNAVLHNQVGGWITLATRVDSGVIEFVVETGGPVLDPAQVARLAEPFQRLSADRTGSAEGSGLGLSIVSAIAATHGGRLDLRVRPQGGLRAAVTLPWAGQEAAT